MHSATKNDENIFQILVELFGVWLWGAGISLHFTCWDIYFFWQVFLYDPIKMESQNVW